KSARLARVMGLEEAVIHRLALAQDNQRPLSKLLDHPDTGQYQDCTPYTGVPLLLPYRDHDLSLPHWPRAAWFYQGNNGKQHICRPVLSAEPQSPIPSGRIFLICDGDGFGSADVYYFWPTSETIPVRNLCSRCLCHRADYVVYK